MHGSATQFTIAINSAMPFVNLYLLAYMTMAFTMLIHGSSLF
jgi:uncharacterized protein YhhL (DUF1145 family)